MRKTEVNRVGSKYLLKALNALPCHDPMECGGRPGGGAPTVDGRLEGVRLEPAAMLIGGLRNGVVVTADPAPGKPPTGDMLAAAAAEM